MTFSHITAEYRCTKCDGARSEHASTLSIPYVITAFIGTIFLSAVLLRTPWNFPWYYFFCIFAGEFLALFIAGLPLSFFFIGGSIVRKCPNCGAAMTLRGRHFTKTEKPRWSDSLLLVFFVAINVVAFIILHQHT